MARRKHRKAPRLALVDLGTVHQVEEIGEALAAIKNVLDMLASTAHRTSVFLEQVYPLFEALEAAQQRRSRGASRANRTRRDSEVPVATDLEDAGFARTRVEDSANGK